MKLHNEDCIEQMQKMIDEGVQVDSVVTDPPYELNFMGKSWDSTGIAFQKETWELAFQLLKPGGHLLAFAGSRTYHRIAVAVEDAGFEIRDQLMWLYGSGFPKSHNIGKKAEEYEGWGTALKPAHEPIVMARKPFKGSVAENVLEHGTGGINIDGCRVGDEIIKTHGKGTMSGSTPIVPQSKDYRGGEHIGRFPSNVMHDGSDVVQDVFGDKSRYFYCAKTSKQDREVGNNHPTVKPTELMRYLCRLVTPKGGVILDPFMGSGSTGKGALLEGFRFIGIEMEREYFDIASARLEAAQKNVQEVLF